MQTKPIRNWVSVGRVDRGCWLMGGVFFGGGGERDGREI